MLLRQCLMILLPLRAMCKAANALESHLIIASRFLITSPYRLASLACTKSHVILTCCNACEHRTAEISSERKLAHFVWMQLPQQQSRTAAGGGRTGSELASIEFTCQHLGLAIIQPTIPCGLQTANPWLRLVCTVALHSCKVRY